MPPPRRGVPRLVLTALVLALLAHLLEPLAPTGRATRAAAASAESAVAARALRPAWQAAGDEGAGASPERDDALLLEARAPEVQWSRAGASDWQAVADRQGVAMGDRVRTGARGAARLLYPRGVVLELAPATGVLVQGVGGGAGDDLAGRLYQTRGTTILHADQAPDAAAGLEIETPAAVVATQGGVAQVQVGADGSTRVVNLGGGAGATVTLRARGAANSVALPPGQDVTVAADAPGAAPLALPAPPPTPPPLIGRLIERLGPPGLAPPPVAARGPVLPAQNPPPGIGALPRTAAAPPPAGPPAAAGPAVPPPVPSAPVVAAPGVSGGAAGALDAQGVGAGRPAMQGPAVEPAVKYDVSPPLRALPAAPPAPPAERRRLAPSPPPAPPGVPSGPDPLLGRVPRAATQAHMPAPSRSFDGLSNVNGVVPADPSGAVGPNHYVQWTNTSIAVYDKSGTRVLGPIAGNSLWSGFGTVCETTNQGDPSVIYDRLAGRWVISQFAFTSSSTPPFHQCVAVSQSADPTGTYCRYDFVISTTTFPDYPKFGAWPDAYYMSANAFTTAGAAAGAFLVAFDRGKMLACQAATQQVFYGSYPLYYGILPSDLDGATPPPAGAPNPFVYVEDDNLGAPADRLGIFRFHVDWTTPANSSVSGPSYVNVAAFNAALCPTTFDCLPQSGTTQKLDALALGQLMYRLAYRNFGDHEALVLNHTVDVDGSGHAGIRWYELRQSGGSGWSLYQQGTYAPDANHRWNGSIAMDGRGNIALGFSLTSSSVFPSIDYVGRLASDPLGSLPQGETALRAGGGSQTGSNRWGDFSELTVDPADDCTFWYTNEYYPSTSQFGWQTRIGSFAFPNCGGVVCSPRPRVNVAVTPTGSGSLQVTISATGTNNTISQLQFVSSSQVAAPNALIDIGGQTGQTVPYTFTVTPPAASVQLVVRPINRGQPVTVPVVVTDGCGTWQTLVGGGPSAF